MEVWQACTNKVGYNGSLTEKRDFLARTAKGSGLAFAGNATAAELDAVRAVRRAVCERARQARHRAERNDGYKGLLSRRLALRTYDSAFRVPLSDYERWLPQQTAEAFKLYGQEGMPLVVIENEAFDLVPSLDDRELADLVYQLDHDVLRAQKEPDDRSLDQVLERLAELDSSQG
ncbi:hypothetical protein [Bradyrhizobium macuxiense]|uniref:hypothetical protein n=1 Tax=Bradyrhizobium macuxiense TaxID=1755647 RepID=UPI0011BF2906|nr:hypothetical protein [Bradyrhizobium macuxiense]